MKLKLPIRIAAIAIIVVGLGVLTYALVFGSSKADEKKVFAQSTMLSGLWNAYKLEYWEDETGRTLDKQQNDITTSEGQSYTMLRAVWQSDKPTFDAAWKWTQEHLQREDKLFSWRWGEKTDGTYGVLTDQGGQNTASDADSDIALALAMAASRWQQSSYLDDSKAVITAMWEEEVITVQDVPYLASNNLEKDSAQDAVMNPSYLSPYAFRIFAEIDREHDWMALVDSSYALINKAMESNLDTGKTANLVPDWILMNKTTGEIRAPEASTGSNLTTKYSYDAMRTTWRLALDYQWNNEARAKSTLSKMKLLSDEWKNNQTVYSTYSHDGTALTTDEPSEVYGTSIGYYMVTDPELADEVYSLKLQTLYDPNDSKWTTPMSYYGDNWTWFGMALYDDKLPNLAEDLK